MAEKSADAERGEYAIGIAVILAALLVSATIWISASGIQQAISKIKLSAGVAPVQQAPSQQQQEAQTQQPSEPRRLTAADFKPYPIKLADYSSAQTKGKPDAKVRIVEYSDFECPYCGRATPTIKQIAQNYDVAVVFRHYPLPFHQNAQKAAEAAECAGRQGKFWEMHDILFANQKALKIEDLKAYAANLSLNITAFNACLDGNQTAGTVSAQLSEGQRFGVQGTPSFFIYSPKDRSDALKAKLASAAATIANKYGGQLELAVVEVDGAGAGVFFAGALPYEDFQTVLKAFN
ncbi:MAG: DsbA family protein [Candidatus Micrarchaeota archaeon]|nr:DsbA family protein [Candidatus Micrarchaeota archaeon]